jgi:hypothetical protein
MAQHKLVVQQYLPNNYPAYRYYIECECGFQTRMSSLQLAESQYNSHLINNGVVQPPQMLTKAQLLEKAKQQAPSNTEETKSKGWKPFGK